MRSTLSSLTLLLAFVLLAPVGASAGAPAPAAIVKSIYLKGDRYGAAAALGPNAKERRALTDSLTALLQRADDETSEGDETPPGFDVTTNSQDFELRKFTVRLVRRDAERATVAAHVTATGIYPRRPRNENIIHYDLVHENGAWRIDDVRSSMDGKEWSLRGLLIEAHELLKSAKK